MHSRGKAHLMERADRVYLFSQATRLTVRFIDCRSLASDDHLVSRYISFQEESAQRYPGSLLPNDHGRQVLLPTEPRRRTASEAQVGASRV